MIQSLIPSLYCFFLKISNHIFFKSNQTLINFCFNFSLIKQLYRVVKTYDYKTKKGKLIPVNDPRATIPIIDAGYSGVGFKYYKFL